MITLSPPLLRIQEFVDAGQCLTEDKLDWNNCITFHPETDKALGHQPSPLIDALHNEEDLKFGHGSMSLGVFSPESYSISNAYPQVALYRVVFKYPGETTLRIPSQLAGLMPVIKAFSTEEFKRSKYAREKIGYIICRKLPIEHNIKLLAQEVWHVHRATQEKFPAKMAAVLRLDIGKMCEFSALLSPNMLVHECIIADLVPPMLQASPNPVFKPLYPQQTGDGHFIEVPPQHLVAARPFEAMAGTSLTFHAASKPNLQDIGKLRNFTFLAFAATKEVEEAFRSDIK